MRGPKTVEASGAEHRRRTGAWYTPATLVDLVVGRTVTADWVGDFGRPLRILDPACGDGRFLEAAVRAVAAAGGRSTVTAVDIDPDALAATADRRIRSAVPATHHLADALAHDWAAERFDLVIGNPPFLSQLATATTRRGASRHGGGPYADAAAEFLALAARLTAGGGRFAFVLPQSILASRDAGAVRDLVERCARPLWSWWSPERHFDAEVVVCALAFERRADADLAAPLGVAEMDGAVGRAPGWSGVVLDALGIPALPPLRCDGLLGDRAVLNANFRDEYYALTAAVSDDDEGPPLVTSGLIDPGRCWWGERPVRFAKRLHDAPRIDLDRLDGHMQRWAARKLVPKVLVANQTRIIEAVCDPSGAWLPGVPVTTIVSTGDTDPREIAAVLTSPVASAWLWSQAAGTGLSARSVRVGPALLAALPWPAGDLAGAVDALDRQDLERCGDAVNAAYGLDREVEAATERTAELTARLTSWWRGELGRTRDGRGRANR